MDGEYTSPLTEEERAARRKARMAARNRKQQARRRRQFLQLFPFFLLLILILLLLSAWVAKREPKQAETPADQPQAMPAEVTPQEPEPPAIYTAGETADTIQLGAELPSAYAVVVDVENGTILAEKDARAVISPASMTKILTLLVGAEHVTDLDDTFTMTIDITDYCYVNDCSVVGLEVGETLDGIRRRVSEEVAARAGGAVGDILAGVSDALRAAMLHPAG